MIHYIPEELIIRIVNYSDSVADLAQYRLVCKLWNTIVEPLMFSKRITINSAHGALALFGHLYRQPTYGKLIRHIHFEDYLPGTIQQGLLHLAFTPNMERITGEIDDDDFYLLMNSIAEKRRGKFDKLKAIPHPSCYSAAYIIVLLNFQSTLEEVSISLKYDNDQDFNSSWDLPSKMELFVSLVKLELEADMEALFDTEAMLVDCPRLKELTLTLGFNDTIHVKSEIEAWAPTNVKIIDTVKKLTITHECRSDLLEYLLFKYPNTDTIEIDVSRPLIASNNNLQRTVNVIKAMRFYKVNFVVNHTDLTAYLKFINADGIPFCLEEDDENEKFRIQINNF